LGVNVCDLLRVPLRVEQEAGDGISKGPDKQASKALLIKEVKKCSPEVIKLFTEMIKAVKKQYCPSK